MGYMGLRSWGESDMAADMVYNHVDGVVKLIRRQLKERGNEFNTDGVVDIALFNESFILPVVKQLALADHCDGTLKLLLAITRDRMEKEIADGEAMSGEDWGGYDNKRMHLRAYRRMLKNLNTSVKVLDKYPDAWINERARKRAARRKK